MPPLKLLFGGDGEVIQEDNFQVLLLVAMIAPLGNAMLSPILESLIGPFGASAADIGLLVSVFWAPSILLIPLVGMLADRHGRRSVLIPSILLFGVSGAAITFTTDYRLVLLLRLIQGIGWAGLIPVVVTSIGDLYAGPREATAQGIRMMVGGATAATFSLLAGILVVISWQFPFLLFLLALPVAALVYVWLDEPTVSEPAVTPDSGDSRHYLRSIFELIRQRRILAIVVARPLPIVAFIGYLTYNSIIVNRLFDGTPVQAGALYAIAMFVVAGSASQTGRIKDRFDSRLSVLLVANVCLVAGFAIVLFAPRLAVASIGVAILSAGYGISVTLYRSFLTSLAPDSLRAGLVGVGATGDRLLGTLTPVAMGAIIATLVPIVGFIPAVQAASLAAAVVGGGGGIVCVLVATVSPTPSVGRPAGPD